MNSQNNIKDFFCNSMNLIPIFTGIFVFGFVFIWYKTSFQVTSLKMELREKMGLVLSDTDKSPFIIDTDTTKNGDLIINDKELEKVLLYVKSLSDQVNHESNRAESIIDKDIDRLNMYMSMGIGFMAILGVFVPILVNINTTSNLREKQKGFIQEVNKVKEQSTKLSKNTDGLLIQNANANLQSSVGRFYYVGQLYLLEIIHKKSSSNFGLLIDDIKEALLECKDLPLHKIENNKKFRTHINDFIAFLETEKVRFNIIFTERIHLALIDSLISSLNKLKNCDLENEGEHYDKVIMALDNFVKAI